VCSSLASLKIGDHDARLFRSASFARPLSLGLFLLFSLLLCGLNTPATAQSGGITVANSSFETPVISSVVEYENGYAMRQAGVNPVWTITDYAGIGLAEYFNKDASGQGQVAPDGNQVGYVQSWHGTGSALWQAVSGLQAGQSYYVIVAAAQDGGNTGGIAMPVQVSLGAQSYTFTPTGTNYRDYTFGPFTGSAGSQTLRFATVTQSTSVNAIVMLDNVRVVPASSAFAEAPGVPTPNFSFEAPTISNYDEFEDGYAMTQAGTNVGWTLSAYSGIGLAEYFNKDEPDRGQLAPDGSQVAYVQSYYSYAPGTISQTVPGFQPGQSYYLIVSAAQCSGNDVALPVVASLGGQTFQFTPSSTHYQDYTFGPVTATAASQTVGFMAVPQSSSVAATVMLDNVRVVLSAAPFTPAGLSLYPATVTGGSSSLGTVTLSSYAPPAGVVVTLQSDNPAATVPASVTVPGGQRSATFTVTTTDIPAATSATITAAAGGVTQTATLTIILNLSLTAAATGSNKVTLYWNGISGASGYNVYRGTVSGGPYSLVASNITTADPGPGMTGSFMYSDTAGLATGTEYFYIVRAVQSGIETMQSNEASDIPQAGAVPWDTGDPVQILNAETMQVSAVLPADIDPDTGDLIPADVGLLTSQGPNGVIYESADADGNPATSFASPGYYDASNHQLVFNDGTTQPVSPQDSVQNPTGSRAATPGGLPLVPFQAQQAAQNLDYPYHPHLGIYRKVESFPGYVGLSTIELIFPSPGTSTGEVSLGQSGGTPGHPVASDSADIYTGGDVLGFGDGALDAGLTLMTSNPDIDPAWGPITYNYYDNPNHRRAPGLVIPARPMTTVVNGQTLAGNQRVLIYGDYRYPLQMSFATGGQDPAHLQSQVALHFTGQYKLIIREVDRTVNNRRILTINAPVRVGSVTLTSWQPRWTYRNGRTMIIKRSNSIAQNIPDNQPWTVNSSHLYGCAWGIGQSGYPSSDIEGQLLQYQGGLVNWDATPTHLAGSYPWHNQQVLYFSTNIPFYAERYINLSTAADPTLPARR